MHGTHEHGHHQHEAHAGHAAPTPSAHRGDHSGPAADAHSGDDQHAGHSPEMFRDRFWLSLLLTVPVVVWSPHIEELLGYSAPRFPYSHQVPTVLGTAVFLYGGLVFLRSALGEIRARRPGMMTLISLAISVAFVFSWVVALGVIAAEALWWELATLVTVMLLGHWIEMRSISQAQGALRELAKLLPDEATRVTESGTETVPVAELREGRVTRFTVSPEDAGLPRAQLADLKGGTPAENGAAIMALLGGKSGAFRDIVLLNAAAALIVADKAGSLRDGAQMAVQAIDSGAAMATLSQLIAITNSPAPG